MHIFVLVRHSAILNDGCADVGLVSKAENGFNLTGLVVRGGARAHCAVFRPSHTHLEPNMKTNAMNCKSSDVSEATKYLNRQIWTHTELIKIR